MNPWQEPFVELTALRTLPREYGTSSGSLVIPDFLMQKEIQLLIGHHSLTSI
jgi:hypothetical protein